MGFFGKSFDGMTVPPAKIGRCPIITFPIRVRAKKVPDRRHITNKTTLTLTRSRPYLYSACLPCSADIPVCGCWGLSSPQAVEEHGAGKHLEPADKNVCATPLNTYPGEGETCAATRRARPTIFPRRPES